MTLQIKDDATTTVDVERTRGWALSTYLILLFVVMSVSYIVVMAALNTAMLGIADVALRQEIVSNVVLVALLLGIGVLGVLISISALWNWKRWGYYGLMAAYVISIVLYVFSGNFPSIIGAVIGMGILYLLLLNKQHMLE